MNQYRPLIVYNKYVLDAISTSNQNYCPSVISRSLRARGALIIWRMKFINIRWQQLGPITRSVCCSSSGVASGFLFSCSVVVYVRKYITLEERSNSRHGEYGF